MQYFKWNRSGYWTYSRLSYHAEDNRNYLLSLLLLFTQKNNWFKPVFHILFFFMIYFLCVVYLLHTVVNYNYKNIYGKLLFANIKGLHISISKLEHNFNRCLRENKVYQHTSRRCARPHITFNLIFQGRAIMWVTKMEKKVDVMTSRW